MPSEGSTSDTVTVDGNSEFFQAISGRKSAEMWAAMGGNSWTRFKLSILVYTTPFCEK